MPERGLRKLSGHVPHVAQALRVASRALQSCGFLVESHALHVACFRVGLRVVTELVEDPCSQTERRDVQQLGSRRLALRAFYGIF